MRKSHGLGRLAGIAGILALSCTAPTHGYAPQMHSPNVQTVQDLGLEDRVSSYGNAIAYSPSIPIRNITITPATGKPYTIHLEEALAAYAKRTGNPKLSISDFAISPDGNTVAYQVDGFAQKGNPYTRILKSPATENPVLKEWKLPRKSYFESMSDPALAQGPDGKLELYFVSNQGLWDGFDGSRTGVIVRDGKDGTSVLAEDGWHNAYSFRLGNEEIFIEGPDGEESVKPVRASNPLPYASRDGTGILASYARQGRTQLVDAPQGVRVSERPLSDIISQYSGDGNLRTAYGIDPTAKIFLTMIPDPNTGRATPGMIVVGKEASTSSGITGLAIPIKTRIPSPYGISLGYDGRTDTFRDRRTTY